MFVKGLPSPRRTLDEHDKNFHPYAGASARPSCRGARSAYFMAGGAGL